MDSVGDMARALVLRNNQVRLRQEMDQLAVEVSTGFVRDSARHLGGDLSGLLSVDRSLARLDTYRINTSEAAYLTGAMQTALDEINTRSETLSQTLIAAELTPNEALLNTMSEDARSALGQTLNGLNRSVAGRFMFSGAATNRVAVEGVEAVLDDLRTVLAGQTTVAGVNATLDTYFGAGGGYVTNNYVGSDTGLAPLKLSDTESANVDIRASDDVFRQLLKPLAMAALATDGALGLSQDVQVDLLAQSGSDLMGSLQGLVELRAGLGALEARVEETTTRNSAEHTATSIARLDLVGTDQYETASRYENIRTQLESIYAITARSQRLSLAEFL